MSGLMGMFENFESIFSSGPPTAEDIKNEIYAIKPKLTQEQEMIGFVAVQTILMFETMFDSGFREDITEDEFQGYIAACEFTKYCKEIYNASTKICMYFERKFM